MNKTEILQEQVRLRVYMLDLEKNLPAVVLASDYNYQVAVKRLEKLKTMLEEKEKQEAKSIAEEEMRIAKSSELLKKMLKEVSNIIDTFEDKFAKLHPNHKSRYLEVMTELKKIRR